MTFSSKHAVGGIVALTLLGSAVAVTAACGSSSDTGFGQSDASASNPSGGDGAASDDGGSAISLGDAGNGNPVNNGGDPTTCAEAEQAKSYVGCDYWPTVVANAVDNLFDFAVVVSNVGTTPATVNVTGGTGASIAPVTVAPGSLQKVYLPWVPALKGTATGGGSTITKSVVSKGGAYHLVSSVPVVVYQFNALEFKGEGGPSGKDWSSCTIPLGATGCYSYSNDAALLLPTTAMTGNYRVIGQAGWSAHPIDPLTGQPQTNKPLSNLEAATLSVTGTVDGTTVTVNLTAAGNVVASTDGAIAATNGGGTLTFSLNAGDVAEIVSPLGNKNDFSGSLLKASNPVQVLTGVPCIYLPLDVQACDHIESTVPPAETLGKHYVVTVPTSPHGAIIGHVVRFFGNADNTTLTYVPSAPSGCPTTLSAGQMVECTGTVTQDFEVTGSNEFVVGSFMLGGALQDPNVGALTLPEGDPSQSLSVAVEQWRKTYLFLAPDDYTESFVDIVGPPGVTVTLDGAAVSASFTPIGSSYGVARVKLSGGNGGAHSLKSDQPVGIQVMGYGANTSYQYPGGLNLGHIAPPPVK